MMISQDGPTFETLHSRLLAAIRRRLNNGEITERGFAKLIGVSQPHVHNVLKGLRIHTPEVADLMLVGLGISIPELLTSEELGRALEDRGEETRLTRHVPLLAGRLGPEERFPDMRAAVHWLRVPHTEVRGARRPILVELGRDPELSCVFPNATHTLVDLDEAGRTMPPPGSWSALRWRGAGMIRQVRRDGSTLSILGQRLFGDSTWPERIELTEGSILQVLRGRVVWMGVEPRGAGVLDHCGVWVDGTASA